MGLQKQPTGTLSASAHKELETNSEVNLFLTTMLFGCIVLEGQACAAAGGVIL